MAAATPPHFSLVSIPQPDLCAALETPYWYAEHYVILLLFSLPILFFVSAPYGKLKSSIWTFDVSPRLGWFIMEAPAWIIHLFLTFAMLPQIVENVQRAYALYTVPATASTTTATSALPPQINLYVVITFVSALLYSGHYIYRSIIYPANIRSSKPHDFLPVILAALFNLANGVLQGVGMYCSAPRNVTDLHFGLYVFGHIGFMLAWAGCYWSDMYLVSLRDRGKPAAIPTPGPAAAVTDRGSKAHYTIPTQGLFRLTYSANYLCEFLQWIAFALMVPASRERWLFVALTFCNLFPRAYQYRRFYLEMARDQALSAGSGKNTKSD